VVLQVIGGVEDEHPGVGGQDAGVQHPADHQVEAVIGYIGLDMIINIAIR
jgi:hypothetical protein